jgi:FdhE protein
MSCDLIAEAHVRSDALLAARPDLAAAVRLQRALLLTIIDELDTLRDEGFPGPAPDVSAAAHRLREGRPAIDAETIPRPHIDLKRVVLQLCGDLAAGGAGEAATRIADAVRGGRLDAGSLAGASVRRDLAGVRAAACQQGFAADLLWLVGELAAGPVVYLLQAQLFGEVSGEMRQLLESWHRGYCPACGSWPALAEIDDAGRTLRCSFCAAAWQVHASACIYCGDAGAGFTSTPDDAGRGHRVELCSACGRYLKNVRVAGPLRFPLLAIEDLASSDLDEAAMEKGFGRPALHESPAFVVSRREASDHRGKRP